jgi:anti-anti-sigma regulatory factor
MKVLADLLEAHFDAVVDESTTRAIHEAGPSYGHLKPEQLRPRTAAGYAGVLADLRQGGAEETSRFWCAATAQRASQGVDMRELQRVLGLAEEILCNLARREIADPAQQIEAITRVYALFAETRTRIFGTYVEVATALQREQLATIRRLSAMVLPLAEGVLLMPVLGTLDEAQASVCAERLLGAVVEREARFVLLDLSGAVTVDAQACEGIVRLVRAVRLLGADVIVVGLGPAMARAVVEQGLGLGDVETHGNLAQGLDAALGRLRKKRG